MQTTVVAVSSMAWWGFWYQQGLNPVSVMASETGQILSSAAPAAEVIESDVIGIIQSVSDSIDAVVEVSWNEAIKTNNVKTVTETVVESVETSPIVSSFTQSVSSAVSSTVDAVSDSIFQPVANPKSVEAGVCAYDSAITKVCVKTGKVAVSSNLVTSFSWLAYAPKVLALAWLGVLSSAAVLVVESVAVGKLSSSETAVVFSTEPLWAAAIGSLFVGEHIGPNTIVGGALVLAACISRVTTPQEIVERFQHEAQKAQRKVQIAMAVPQD